MSINPRHRIIALVAAVSLGFAACGADETIEVGAPVPETVPDDPIEQEFIAEQDATIGLTPMTPRSDLVALQPATPDDVLVDPANDQHLLVRFQGAAEPCAGAAVTVTETETTVTVQLETGLDPNAAAMSCIAQVFDYEIVITLDAPLGDREILAEPAN